MKGRETARGILTVPRLGCDAYPDQRDRPTLLLKDHVGILQRKMSSTSFRYGGLAGCSLLQCCR